MKQQTVTSMHYGNHYASSVLSHFVLSVLFLTAAKISKSLIRKLPLPTNHFLPWTLTLINSNDCSFTAFSAMALLFLSCTTKYWIRQYISPANNKNYVVSANSPISQSTCYDSEQAMKQSKLNVSRNKYHDAVKEIHTDRLMHQQSPTGDTWAPYSYRSYPFQHKCFDSHIRWKGKKTESILVSSVFKPHGNTDFLCPSKGSHTFSDTVLLGEDRFPHKIPTKAINLACFLHLGA